MITQFIKLCIEITTLPFLALFAIASRFYPKKFDIGLGPLPLINNVYHKKALELNGWKVETFVSELFHITNEFDIKFNEKWKGLPPFIRNYLGFLWVIRRYRCLYIYFNGSVLAKTRFLWRFEGPLLKLAQVRTVILAYGSDVQEMTRSPNLPFKHVMSKDYPGQSRKRNRISKDIDHWLTYGSHVVGGCEWVDYIPGWDSLMIAHFSIDTAKWKYQETSWAGPAHGPLKLLHAPNHRNIKGTDFLLAAVEELKREGLDIELMLLEKVPNHKIQEVMHSAHVIVDQLVIGWYAMFAIEAMSSGRVVICNLRSDLTNLYEFAGFLAPDEIPLVSSDFKSIKDTIRQLYTNPGKLAELGKRGRKYVEDHHSIESVGRAFNAINLKLNLTPSGTKA